MKKIVQFFRECYAELHKVVWPGRDDVVSSVVVVLVSTGIIGMVLFAVDYLLIGGVKVIFR